MKNQILLIIWLVFTSGVLYAQIINIPADYPSIQQGVDSASNGDTVLVAPGTYYENIVINNKYIVLASWYITTLDTSYISQTVIDADSNGNAISLFSYSFMKSTGIQGFTITNGYGIYDGGGIYVYHSLADFKNLVITNNYSDNGGGIALIGAVASIVDVKITDNESINGGGIYTDGGDKKKARSICEWSNVTISNNFAERGAGIYRMSWADVNMCNSIIENNSASSSGGGIYSKWEGDTRLKNVKISGNTSGAYGGGIYGAWCFDKIILENCELDNNSSAHGGGLYVYNTPTYFTNVLINNNNAENNGGGIGGDILHAYIDNVTITNNVAEEGNGIFCEQSRLDFKNSIIFSYPSQQIVCSSEGDSSIITVSNSLIMGGQYFIKTNDNATVNWLEGNINQNPQFVVSGEFPYQLNDNSPCIDAGSTDTTGITEFDLAGEPRFFNGRIDMGAYEWNTFVGVDEQTVEANNFKIYPNPSNKQISISLNNQSVISKISVYNQMGQRVLYLENPDANIDISELDDGLFVIEVFSEGKKFCSKLIKN